MKQKHSSAPKKQEVEKSSFHYGLYIILAGCLWGMISIFIRVLNENGLNSMKCVAVRAFFTTLILFVYLMVTERSKLKIAPRDIKYFLGTGICSILFFNYCYFETIDLIGGAAIPALLLYTAPIFVMLLSAIFFGEKITKHKFIALVVTFVGLGFVTGAFTGGETLSVPALVLGLGSGLGYALYSIFGKLVVHKYDAVTITFYTFLIATIGGIPLSGIVTDITIILQFENLMAILGLALLSTVLPFLLYTKGLQGTEAGKASILATVEPFTAAIVGFFVFNEGFTVEKIIGMLMIFIAIIYLNVMETKPVL